MIKKLLAVMLLCSVIIWGVSCSFSAKKPEGGFWYCEELNTGIDFDLYQTTLYCVFEYRDDGGFKINGCRFDYGNGVHFFFDSDDGECGYLYGEFKYDEKNNQFTITTHSEGATYTFIKQEKRK